MILKTKLLGKIYSFKDVKDVLSKANEEKSGDILAGIAAETAAERVAAKVVLSELTINDLRNNPVISWENDEISRMGEEAIDEVSYNKIKSLTIGEFRELLLKSSGQEIAAMRNGLTAEMIAGVTKLMSNMDLVTTAKKIINPVTCNTTIGKEGTFSGRLQPNNAKDDIDGIMASVMDGLSYGVGDAVIGLNPVGNNVELVKTALAKFKDFTNTWNIPTQNCVLAHIETQMEALRQGCPNMDLMFQSVAGTEAANKGFGINKTLIDEAYHLMEEKRSSKGPNFMYFETGQGSELSLEAHNGADQVTLEARCYTFAKRYKPFLVNTVVGFIGPEYLYDGKQTIRAGLEDHFMGKLTGLPMGVDCCHTNHMKSDQNDTDNLSILLGAAGCTYIMGIPIADDVMLMNQTTSYHDIASIRELYNKRPSREFEKAMERLGIMENGRLTKIAGDPSIFVK
ncbi:MULTISPECIES: ethanolamine ammonia-lyase subunit EutB [Clostridium]|uniref:ethanolamine ammonia-lyase subunit EutB n=1 Tax=Clostridium TaxID=1485 RepID=UPI000825CB62|nr:MULTISPECIES: ethanolamine ammonia-lyase subunit EutB [Clostridium]PJI09306.1 ethanolamine ammonia lyase large subunit [Clostridium sp. CT7]